LTTNASISPYNSDEHNANNYSGSDPEKNKKEEDQVSTHSSVSYNEEKKDECHELASATSSYKSYGSMRKSRKNKNVICTQDSLNRNSDNN